MPFFGRGVIPYRSKVKPPCSDVISFHYNARTVTLYNDDGYVSRLPDLNEGRNEHGCGHFLNSEHKIVSMINDKTCLEFNYAKPVNPITDGGVFNTPPTENQL